MKLSLLPLLAFALPLMTMTASGYTIFVEGREGPTPGANQWPLGRVPLAAVDFDNETIYRNFGKLNTGYFFTSVGRTIVTGIKFVTANNAEERDPASFILFGSTVTGGLFESQFTKIAAGTLALPSGRSVAGGDVTFANSLSYSNYILVFPTLKNADLANSMQIAEAQLQNAQGPLIYGVVAGGQITEIPEPTALGLVAASCLIMGARRRRSHTEDSQSR